MAYNELNVIVVVYNGLNGIVVSYNELNVIVVAYMRSGMQCGLKVCTIHMSKSITLHYK